MALTSISPPVPGPGDEKFPEAADPDVQVREVALLQQRTRALEGEIQQRKELEQALRAALAERERLEEELRRQNDDLSRTVRFSEMFLGILGHDLRNPLSAITTAASVLQRRADSDKVTRPVARILNSAGRMGRMIDQLLDFTRIRLGKGIPIDPKRTDLGELCRLSVDEFVRGGAAGTISLEVIGGDSVGCWDTDRLLQLVANLISNALTHRTPGGPVTIAVDCNDAETIRLTVHNAGVIPPQVLPVLFEPFRSDRNEKRERSDGLGLGLLISRQIVFAHSGSIEVTSSEANGTHFIVSLPRLPAVLDRPMLPAEDER